MFFTLFFDFIFESNLPDTGSSTLNKVVRALNAAGIEFITRDDGAIGAI